MKNIVRILLISLFATLAMQSSWAQRSRTIQRDTKFKQIGTGNIFILFKAGTQVKLTTKNEVLEGTLATDTKIARPGWPETAVLFKGGTKIIFHQDGAPYQGTLAQNAKFIRFGSLNKHSLFLSGTKIELDPSSLAKSGTLAQEEILDVASGKVMKFKKGNQVNFNNKGLVTGY